MKLKLLFLTLFISGSIFSQTWQFEGAAEFSTAASNVSIAIDNNDVPFVAYADKASDGKLHIKKYDGTNWVSLGDVASTAGMIPEMVVIKINPITNQPWVIYKNTSTSRVDLISYDGTNWIDEGTSIGNFEPFNKIAFSIDSSGDPVFAAQASSSSTATYLIRTRLYAKRGATWIKEIDVNTHNNAYDLGNANTFTIGEEDQRFNRYVINLKVLEYNGTSWIQTYYNQVLNSGGDNGFCDGLAAASKGATDKFLYDYRRGSNAQRQLRFENESVITGDNQIPSNAIYGLEYKSVGGKYFVMHYNPSSDLKIYSYNESSNIKTDLAINLNFSGNTPSSQILLNNSQDKLYLAYLDLATQKVSVQYYNILPPRSLIYVNQAASGNNSGNTWTDAYTSLSDALENADANFSEIWVAKGTYKPDATNRNKHFGIAGLKIYGGFNGNETTLEQRDLKNNITILSGDLNGDDTGLDFSGNNRDDNSYNVVKITANNSIVDGFTIQDGQATGPSTDLKEGGAIFVNSGLENFTISNSVIKNNVAARGGAIRVIDSKGSLNLENLKIHNNLALFGTVLYVRAPSGSTLNTNILNCLMYDNTLNNSGDTTSPGTVAWFRQDLNATQNVKIINSTFTRNNYISNSVTNSSVINASTSSGGVIMLETSNSIYYGNFSNNNSFLKSVGNSTTQSNGTLSAYNCIAQDFMNQVSTKANIIANNPDFTDSFNNDFTLLATSAAIDSGDNSKIPSTLKTDLVGNSRVFNTTVDMGAYEFGSSIPVDRTLALTATNGSVTTNPNPVNGFYNDGSSVELTATPAAGYQFDSWSGDASGNVNPLTITMDADKNITATFSLIQRTLTTTAANGTIARSVQPTNGTYDNGTILSLTATPINGYQFNGWSGDATGNTNPLSVTMDADKNITATFSLIQRTLTTTAANGTITRSVQPTNGTYDNGTILSLTATPSSGYQFDGWSGDATGNTNPLTLTMDADKSITATFSLIQQTLTITAANGTVAASPNPTNGTYENGTVVTLTATPDTGFGFIEWTGDVTATTNTITVTMDADKTVVANFSSTASADDFNKFDFKIYPNPVNTTLNIDASFTIKKVFIYNLIGQKVLESELKNIDTANLKSGMYLIKIIIEEGNSAIKRFVKK